MATRAQIAAARRNIKKAQAARWGRRSHGRRHSSESTYERSRAAKRGWGHHRERVGMRRASHRRYR